VQLDLAEAAALTGIRASPAKNLAARAATAAAEDAEAASGINRNNAAAAAGEEGEEDSGLHLAGGGGGGAAVQTARGSTPMAALEAAARAAPVPARPETVAALADDDGSALQPFAKMLLAGAPGSDVIFFKKEGAFVLECQSLRSFLCVGCVPSAKLRASIQLRVLFLF
jgi:hypothetical protein